MSDPMMDDLHKNSAVAIVENDCIVIRVPFDCIPQALKGARDVQAIDLAYKVTNAAVFAKAMILELNREDEVGTTAVHRMLDRAMATAIEDGCEGVEDDPDEDGDQ